MPNKPSGGDRGACGAEAALPRCGLVGACLLLTIFLGACSTAPEWADPGKIFDDDSHTKSQYVDPDAPIPNLASVPSRPRILSARETRAETRDALALDLENAEVIRGDAQQAEISAALGLDGKVRPAAIGDSEIIAVIYFGEGSASLAAEDRGILGEVARLQQQRGTRLKVIGHSSKGGVVGDPETARQANLRISEKRAEGVVRALISLGVEAGDLLYSGVGDRDRLYDESEVTGEAGNRRTEIFLETQTQAQ